MKKNKYVLLIIFLSSIFLSVSGITKIGKSLYNPVSSTKDTTISEAINQDKMIDGVLCVIGDEPILKSEVEMMRLQSEAEGVKWRTNNPTCAILEQLAIQKLFLHQASLDSITVKDSEVAQEVEQQINYFISLPQIGSKEKLEEYQHKSIAQIRQDLFSDLRNRQLVQRMQESLVSNVKVSPAEVREYFRMLPVDSIPMIPTTVEVEILTLTPKVDKEEIARIKNKLRSYTERINKGETSFSTLARLYSEDPVSARQGGELGYIGRASLDPAFASVAFNLTDPTKVSKIVESEFGYHIIQLIDRRGERINCRHILLKPKISVKANTDALLRLDSIANDIRKGKFSFEEAVSYISDDKDTHNSNGLMINSTQTGRTSRFAMKDLPTEIARVVEKLNVGEISAPFSLVNNKGKQVCAIIKLKNRINEHRATITEDFQKMKDIVTIKRRKDIIHNWIANKVKETYIRMSPEYRDCDFEYQGWFK